MIEFSNMNFAGHYNWSEGNLNPRFSTVDEEINGNLDLLEIPQYGRNPDHAG